MDMAKAGDRLARRRTTANSVAVGTPVDDYSSKWTDDDVDDDDDGDDGDDDDGDGDDDNYSPLSMERVLERIRRRFCLRGTRAEQALLLKKKSFTL